MRIIAGAARGRRLIGPKGRSIRPTPDRVREALFCLPVVARQVPGARVLDLFAGTGALGLEALSRGAQHTTFVDHKPQALALLRRNIAAVGMPEKMWQVMPRAADRALLALARQQRNFDLAFLDPPYDAALLEEALLDLLRRRLLVCGGLAVCEHRASFSLASTPPGCHVLTSRRFGSIAVTIVTVNEPQDPQ